MMIKRKISWTSIILWMIWLSPPLLYAVLIAHGIFQQSYHPVDCRSDVATRKNTALKNGGSDGLVDAKTNGTINRSSQDGVTNKPLDYEIVISQYDENINWTKPLANHSHVYHKGKDNGPPFDVYKWEKLPNVGREAHTYLYHIIHNYDNLADITVFLQGTGPAGDHREWCFASTMEFVERAKKEEYCNARLILETWGRINYPPGVWRERIRSGYIRRSNLTLGEFYSALFGTTPTVKVPVCWTACVSATRENLRRFPVSVYEKAISFVSDHSNPEEAHYLERLWATIVNPKNSDLNKPTI